MMLGAATPTPLNDTISLRDDRSSAKSGTTPLAMRATK
jgi:hypothetical protein